MHELFVQMCDVLPGNEHKGKLHDKQQSVLLKKTAILPKARADYIRRQAKLISKTVEPMISQLGLKMATEMEKVPARVLTSPFIQYADGQASEGNI